MSKQGSSSSFKQWFIGIAVLVVLASPLLYSAIIVPLSPVQQATVALALIILAIVASFNRTLRPLIIFLSCFASARYFYWRVSSTLNLDSTCDAIVSILLLAAEVYGVLILFLGYFQTVEMIERTPPALTSCPTVDVFIATYNESIDIVRRTLIGALAIDYPNKCVYVLDDGHRPEVENLARCLGSGYITRPTNIHAKAGNLNHALTLTHGTLVAVFDADHVPVRSFLRNTVGFFENSKVALAQVAQHFFNPDPFERNLNLTGRVAPEQHFFYHVIQCGNDFWNSAFFCGTSAVLRRSALEEVGGIKTETVTEDAHTALELHSRGYQSVYLRMPLAAGLATETFAAHVKQRMRWARGMAQILWLDCPLFKKGLSLPQRLNYFNAMFHFFFGIPRLILVLAPLTYLFLGLHPIRADTVAVIAYILPHIGLSTIANSKISRRFRHSFWAGVYEVSIAPYAAISTALAILSPKSGKFNVTDKGASIDRARFDFRTSWPILILLGLTLTGLVVAFPLRLILFAHGAGDPSELDSIVLNSLWVVGNLAILIAAACVALEQPQQRGAPRVKRTFPCELILNNERLPCTTADLSENGVRVVFDQFQPVRNECEISISSDFGVQTKVKVKLVRLNLDNSGVLEAGFAFVDINPKQLRELIEIIFTGEQSWTHQDYPEDNLLRSFWYLLTTFWRATKPRRVQSRSVPVLRGQWRAYFQEHEFECVAVSGSSAWVRPNGKAPIVDMASEFRLELTPDVRLTVGSASAMRSKTNSDLYTMHFRWASFHEERAFWQELYTRNPLPPSERQKPFPWRRIMNLK